MVRWKSWRWVCLLLLVSRPLIGSAANLVLNGGFETNGGVGQINVSPAISYATGWTSGPNSETAYSFNFIVDANADNSGFPSVNTPERGTNIFVWGPETPANKGGPQANGFTGSPSGGYFLGMDSGYATGPMSQTINGLDTTKTYRLSFEYAFGQFTDRFEATSQSIGVTFGGATSSTPTFNLPERGFSGWQTFSQDFTPTSASQLLSFLAVGPYGLPPFAFLDNVKIEEVNGPPPPPAVPEPGSLGLAALGLCAVVGRYRRLKARQG